MDIIGGDPVRDTVAEELSSTQYACSQLLRLSGGTANFVYRGTLSKPLNDGTVIVIVKHAEDYIASNKDFKLSATRCLIEESALRALDGMSSVTTTNEGKDGQKYQITVKTPKLFHFDSSTNTQVMENLQDAVDLKTFLLSPSVAQNISKEWTLSIGRTIGIWLRSFHLWIADAAQADVAAQLGKNETMKKLKFSINYDSLIKVIDAYPDLLEGSRSVFEKVRDLAAAELNETQGGAIGPIHGDFWSGNVLIPRHALDQPLPTTPLLITDWELAQWGNRALDLGQMIAELYMLKHFKGIDDGLWAIEGFVEGYHDISHDIAFRTIIHVGVHLIFWGSTISGWGTKEQVSDVVQLGRDLITKAWEKDRRSFEGEIWNCLFRI
ncbi:kinase-like domain-containing protein [Aspergillus cavernicola]|uniref:Kinase-like domain-containing protein n=1 Tax=Aspergillus cavernicola TaxID=176166 RepID=A0ABR4HZ81_9EURO